MKIKAVVLASLVVCGIAKADVICTTVKREKSGKTERGVTVSIPGSKYSESVWFGTDAQARSRAANGCQAVLKASHCTGETPRAQDRYMNVGDPGFGPRLMVEKSSRAGRLHLNDVPGLVQPYLPKNASKQQEKYFAFYDSCEEARADLALDTLEKYQDEYESKNRSSDDTDNWYRILP